MEYKSETVREHYDYANKFIRFYEWFGNTCILLGFTLVLMLCFDAWNIYILSGELIVIIGFYMTACHYETLMYDTWMSEEEEAFLEQHARKYNKN